MGIRDCNRAGNIRIPIKTTWWKVRGFFSMQDLEMDLFNKRTFFVQDDWFLFSHLGSPRCFSGGFAGVFFLLTKIKVSVPSVVFCRNPFCGSFHFREPKTQITFCFGESSHMQRPWFRKDGWCWCKPSGALTDWKTITLQIFTFAININKLNVSQMLHVRMILPTWKVKKMVDSKGKWRSVGRYSHPMEHLGTGQNATWNGVFWVVIFPVSVAVACFFHIQHKHDPSTLFFLLLLGCPWYLVN